MGLAREAWLQPMGETGSAGQHGMWPLSFDPDDLALV